MGLGRSRQGDVLNHAECGRMVEVFEPRGLSLFVAYYRRALPRFVHARELLRAGTTGTSTSVHIFCYDGSIFSMERCLAGAVTASARQAIGGFSG